MGGWIGSKFLRILHPILSDLHPPLGGTESVAVFEDSTSNIIGPIFRTDLRAAISVFEDSKSNIIGPITATVFGQEDSNVFEDSTSNIIGPAGDTVKHDGCMRF